MADKTQPNGTPEGTSFRDLINHVTGKTNATREEFESAISGRGYSTRDVRKIGKAFDRVQTSGNEYILHPTKGFDVFDNGKKQSGSGKAKGNKAGADLGDLINLGGDVSLLAGALRNEKKGYDESRAPKTELPEPEQLVASLTKNEPSAKTTTSSASPVKKSATAKSAVVPIKKKVTVAPYPGNLEISDKGNAEFPYRPLDKNEENLNSHASNIQDIEDSDHWLSRFLIGDQVTGAIFGKNATQEQKDAKRADMANRPHQSGHRPTWIWSNDERTPDELKMDQQYDAWNERGKSIGVIPNFGLLDPVSGVSLLKNTKVGKFVADKLGKYIKTFEEFPRMQGPQKMTNFEKVVQGTKSAVGKIKGRQAKNIKYPLSEPIEDANFLDNLTEDMTHYEKGGVIRSLAPMAHSDGDWTGFSGMISHPYGEENLGGLPLAPYNTFMQLGVNTSGVPDNYGHTATKPDRVPKGKKGMKIMGTGGITPYKPSIDMDEENPYGSSSEYQSSPLDPNFNIHSEDPDFFKEGTYVGSNHGSQREGILRALLHGGQKETNPNGRGSGFLKNSDIPGGLVKYGVPAAWLLAENSTMNNRRRQAIPDIQAPQLMTGAIQDMYHPDFSLPYRPTQDGSSQSESMHNAIARDKFQREHELQWQEQNSASKINQKNAVIDRMNQQIQANTSAANQKKSIAAQNAEYEFLSLLQDRGQTAGSLFQNLDNGISERNTVRDAKTVAGASAVIRDPNSTPEQRAAARRALGFRKGGKMKSWSKYSKC